MQIDQTLIIIVMGLQAWCLKEVVSLKVSVATLTNEHIEMKKKIAVPLITILAVACLVLFSGCASTGGIGEAMGNVAAAPGKILNGAAKALTGVTTNITESVSNTGEVTRQTNYTAQVDPRIAGSIATASTLSKWIPDPWADAVTLGLAGAAGMLELARRRRQRQLDQTNQDLTAAMADTADVYNQLEATVRGVEKSVKENKPVKEAIAKEAARAGVAEKLNQTVQGLT